MFKNLRKLAVIMTAIVLLGTVLLAGGCKSPYHLELGFRSYSNHEIARSPTHAGVRSREATFNVDEVILEFHFGHYWIHWLSEATKSSVVSVGLFFVHGSTSAYTGPIFWLNWENVKDYRNVADGVHFIREISPEEFFTPEFEVKSRRGWSSRYTFAHSEQIQVPSSIFNSEKGQRYHFYFLVVLVTQNEEGYNLALSGYRPEIHYRLLENNQVRVGASHQI